MAMITREQAKEAVHEVGRKYEQLSYSELERLVDEDDGVPPEEELLVDDTPVTFQPNLARITSRRERISVEIFMDADGMDRWWWRPCYYFEKYPTGEINRFDKFDWQDALLLAFVAVGLAGIVWFVYDLVKGFMH